jgi:hypothetical protein
VAETDARAVEEYEPHFWYCARNLLRSRETFQNPPGHSSIEATMSIVEARRRSRPGNLSTWAEVE